MLEAYSYENKKVTKKVLCLTARASKRTKGGEDRIPKGTVSLGKLRRSDGGVAFAFVDKVKMRDAPKLEKRLGKKKGRGETELAQWDGSSQNGSR